MSLAQVFTRAQVGIDAPLVAVEVHLSNGLPAFNIVGLPETAVKEARDRVRSALLNSQFEFPDKRITVNLAPADLPKDGGRFDLAIAIGILAASAQVPSESLADYEFLSELALSGELRSVRASLPASLACADAGRQLVLSAPSATEAALAGKHCLCADNLLQVCAHLHGRALLPRAEAAVDAAAFETLDLADVKGQYQARRALEIAACGGHNLLFVGPPGTGKTMLASRLPGILPPLGARESLAVAAIYSAAGDDFRAQLGRRPFRNPHHTASAAALVGGGALPRPGEVSLAHRGVLFLDELPEFPRAVLEVLREPLESGEIRLSRARAQICYPADFQLLAAMNPCPCGHSGNPQRACRCSPDQVRRYRQKISGPLLDRIDLQVAVLPLKMGELQAQSVGESSAQVGARVRAGLERQFARQGCRNAELGGKALEQHCMLSDSQRQFMERALEKLALSARAFHRCLRVARTLADLAAEVQIADNHLREALSYRLLDRQL